MTKQKSPTRSAEYKKKQLERQKERRAKDPEKYREMGRKSEHNRRLRRYGLTADQYASMWEEQYGKCAICKTKLIKGRSSHVDHCHESGRVRGILCHHCNLLLGNARDNANILKNAIRYLRDSS